VIVSFSGYEPPFDPVPIVRRMLDSVPRKYLAGLSTVMLSNASGLSGKRRKTSVKRRKRRMMLAAASGAYHPASRSNRAWIEIFVDNALRGWETGWWLRVPFVREARLSGVVSMKSVTTFIVRFARNTVKRRMWRMYGKCVYNAITIGAASAG